MPDHPPSAPLTALVPPEPRLPRGYRCVQTPGALTRLLGEHSEHEAFARMAFQLMEAGRVIVLKPKPGTWVHVSPRRVALKHRNGRTDRA